MSSGIFISWTRENGRTADLAERLGLQPNYIYQKSRFGLLGRYLAQYRQTKKLLRSSEASVVALMLPPFPALLAVHRNTKADTKLFFDLHTGFFYDPKWRWAAKSALKIMQRRGTAIVTNDHLRREAEAVGAKAIVLHDIIKDEGVTETHKGFLLCPVTYANDEPIEEILKAAAGTAAIEWKLTGRAPQSVKDLAPKNVTFTGFVSDEEFQDLLHSCAGVVALTTRPHTMQRAGYESFNVGTAQITSDFPELRDFYLDSAVYTSPEASNIAEAAKQLFEQREELVQRVVQLRKQRIEEQQSTLQQLVDEIR